MAEVIMIMQGPGAGCWYFSCDLCMMAGPTRSYRFEAMIDAEEHNSDDVHRMNEVHESRSSRR